MTIINRIFGWKDPILEGLSLMSILVNSSSLGLEDLSEYIP